MKGQTIDNLVLYLGDLSTGAFPPTTTVPDIIDEAQDKQVAYVYHTPGFPYETIEDYLRIVILESVPDLSFNLLPLQPGHSKYRSDLPGVVMVIS